MQVPAMLRKDAKRHKYSKLFDVVTSVSKFRLQLMYSKLQGLSEPEWIDVHIIPREKKQHSRIQVIYI